MRLLLASWDDILKETQAEPSAFDVIRRKYLKRLSEHRNRNVIAYYSGWLEKQDSPSASISDADMTGFMTCVHGLDCNKGLDLILHTPGGDPTAAEAIVSYLRDKFNNNIEVIVPHLAMSAGTMMACAGKKIIMGRQSSLGPIDPQFSGISAYSIQKEFEQAKSDLAQNPANQSLWAIRLSQFPAAFLQVAIEAIDLSNDLLRAWLSSCMFGEDDNETIETIIEHLNEHEESKNHGRHLNAEKCRQIGLKIDMMEDDDNLQDAILSVHHAYAITLNNTGVGKIIENQNGTAFISRG